MNPLIEKIKSWSWLGVGIGLVYAVIFGVLFLFAATWLNQMPMLPKEFVLGGTVMFILGMVAYVIIQAVIWGIGGVLSYVSVPIGAVAVSKKSFYEVHLWFPVTLLSLGLALVSGTFALIPFIVMAVISLAVLYPMVFVLRLFKWSLPTI